jgi:hypothetical protein
MVYIAYDALDMVEVVRAVETAHICFYESSDFGDQVK